MWVALVGLIALDFFVAVVRASLANARLPYLLNLRESRPAVVDRAVAAVEKRRLRVSLRLAMNLIHVLLGCVTLVILWQVQGISAAPAVLSWGQAAIIALTVLLVGVGEFALEGAVMRRPEEAAIHLALVGQAIEFLLAPLSSLLQALWRLPDSGERVMSMVTDDDLRAWVEEGQPQGSLEQGERKMIASIFQFGETLANQVMVPRIDVLGLEISTPISEAIESLVASGHSRVPVYEENIDHTIGLLYAKDLLKVKIKNDSLPLSALRHILRPAYFVPEAKKVDELLAEMQARRVHIVILVDEYGGMAGLATLEDIIEEIVGEIRDEYDQAEESLFQQVGEDEYIFQGGANLDDFNEVMGAHLEKESADTLGGFVYARIGRVPSGGEQIEEDGMELVVEQVIGKRIRKVRARRIMAQEDKETEDADTDR